MYLTLPVSNVPSRSSLSPWSSQREVHLLDCLRQFAKHEELCEENWAYCERTRRCERSHKKLDIWTAPECLIVHLKRFAVKFPSGPVESTGFCDLLCFLKLCHLFVMSRFKM